ncbi:MAG: hypothetical protein IIA85_03355 [Nanoarchaeota archaeon]|nr:hypothetical protein [Nanoarchaeota archaeon]
MNKKLLLFSVAIILIMSVNAVSGFHYPSQYTTNDFKQTTEFRQTTEQRIGDYWNYELTKRTITEKTVVRKVTRTPSYNPYYSSYGNYYVPYSNWRFKESYVNSRYVNAPYNDYYYKPRYDYTLRYYNWRW